MKVLFSLFVLFLCLNFSVQASHKIEFKEPFVLKASDLNIEVSEVKEYLNQDTVSWEEYEKKQRTHQCDVTIKIKGRDLAKENALLGEHYFGNMHFNCEARGIWFFDGFQTVFSRVFFLGIRNCVESETMVDSDYCNLAVVALRKESDLSKEHQDLWKDKREKRVFFRISSNEAKQNFKEYDLGPDGLNPSILDSYMIFKLSIGTTGEEFFIENPNSLSAFAKNRNHYFETDPESLGRDQTLRDSIEKDLSELESIVHDIESSLNPKPIFEQKISIFLEKFSKTTERLLAVISPVTYFQLEQRLKSVEKDIVELSKAFHENISDHDSFVRKYGEQFKKYSRVNDYLQSSANNIEKVLTPLKEPQVDKEFSAKTVCNTDWDICKFVVCRDAENACNEYLKSFPYVIRNQYQCKERHAWNHGDRVHCSVGVKRR